MFEQWVSPEGPLPTRGAQSDARGPIGMAVNVIKRNPQKCSDQKITRETTLKLNI